LLVRSGALEHVARRHRKHPNHPLSVWNEYVGCLYRHEIEELLYNSSLYRARLIL
jgi:hypothetical protein